MVEFWIDYGFPLLIILLKIMVILVPVLIGVAFATYFDRKIWEL